jgi:hypothetical protein
MSPRACLLLPCVLALAQCGIAYRVGQLGRGDSAEQPAHDPERRGWALMMSDEEFARYKAAATSASPASGGDPAHGAAAGGDGGLFDFSSMLPGQAGAGTQVVWQRSATDAGTKSRLTGTPLLIYATHSASKPCRDIETTLMVSPAFREMAQQSFIPLLIDYSDQETNRTPLYRELKSRFDFSYPTLVVTLPDGTEVSRLKGYKPEYEKRHLEALHSAVTKAEKLVAERRAPLAKSGGYRMWTNKDGKPVFARLTALDANMGSFEGEWGEPFKTFLTRLSEEDQAWIAERRK